MFDGLSKRAILETLATSIGDVTIIVFFAVLMVLFLRLTGLLQ